MEVFNIADIVNPATGKTSRETNWETNHQLPVGTLVEFRPDENDSAYKGIRLYVVRHDRDCDGTPLYVLGLDRTELIGSPWGNFHTLVDGIPEQMLISVSEL